jgi:hypothetical protein
MTEPAFEDRTARTSVWESVAVVLIVTEALILLSGVAFALAGENVSTVDRIETLSSAGASLLTALLVLATVLALTYRGAHADPARARSLFVMAIAIGAIVVLLSIFSIIHLGTADETSGVFGLGNGKFAYRVAQILLRIASAIVAALGVVLANRNAPLSGSRGSGGRPRG